MARHHLVASEDQQLQHTLTTPVSTVQGQDLVGGLESIIRHKGDNGGSEAAQRNGCLAKICFQ